MNKKMESEEYNNFDMTLRNAAESSMPSKIWSS